MIARSHANLPEYPYGPSLWYKQSNFGLYGGLKISSGNNVSPETETKTRRKWRPNVQMKRLYSHALGRYIRVKVAARVLRTVDKCGGLDEYLVGEKPARIKELGMKGWELRCKIMETPWWLERKVRQRGEWGLSPLRTYFPTEKEDETQGNILLGMFGEQVQEAAKEAAESLDEHEIPGDSEIQAQEKGEVEESIMELPGRYEAPAEYKYVNGKLKRRAIVKEVKAVMEQERNLASGRKRLEEGIEKALVRMKQKQKQARADKENLVGPQGSDKTHESKNIDRAALKKIDRAALKKFRSRSFKKVKVTKNHEKQLVVRRKRIVQGMENLATLRKKGLLSENPEQHAWYRQRMARLEEIQTALAANV